MIDLATYMVLSVSLVFFTGALVALAWSVASGQWHDLASASRIVLDDDPAPDDSMGA